MELEDQNWFPNILRNQQTAFIGFTVSAFEVYKPLLPLLKVVLDNHNQWTDCCSGAAGPVIYLQKNGSFNGSVLLTDKFPNKDIINSLPQNLTYSNCAVNILKDEIEGTGLITVFNAFHHFSRLERQQIITKLKALKRPFVIAEILQPTIFCGLKVFITATVGQLLLAPFIKPFSLLRLIFTYLLPINIITVLWDGLASVARAIPYKHLQYLAKNNNCQTFNVEAGTFKTPYAVITYLTGKPI